VRSRTNDFDVSPFFSLSTPDEFADYAVTNSGGTVAYSIRRLDIQCLGGTTFSLQGIWTRNLGLNLQGHAYPGFARSYTAEVSGVALIVKGSKKTPTIVRGTLTLGPGVAE
jgi:hypothetical protein